LAHPVPYLAVVVRPKASIAQFLPIHHHPHYEALNIPSKDDRAILEIDDKEAGNLCLNLALDMLGEDVVLLIDLPDLHASLPVPREQEILMLEKSNHSDLMGWQVWH